MPRMVPELSKALCTYLLSGYINDTWKMKTDEEMNARCEETDTYLKDFKLDYYKTFKLLLLALLFPPPLQYLLLQLKFYCSVYKKTEQLFFSFNCYCSME